ncbi:MAG: FAD-dependent oxidoreductase [Phycisphaerales bacterium]|nr:FAD-dependent oxidoreductase [Phycisphaerales bacterium]
MPDMTATSPTTAIIGAGIAGLSAARILRDHGEQVVVFEKSRGPGGRAARRRQDGFEFDHGAQYFTAREEPFRACVHAMCANGSIAEWTQRIITRDVSNPIDDRTLTSTARYVGVPGMSNFARALGRDVSLQTGHRVEQIERRRDGWILHCTDETSAGPFTNLLLTAPAPQTVVLLDGIHSDFAARCRTVRMAPCWALMSAFEAPCDADFEAARIEGHDVLRWIARNASKPGRPAAETWIAHARPDWSSEHLDDDHDSVCRTLCSALCAALRTTNIPTFSTVHRWRYALVEQPLGEKCLFDPKRRLGVAGDWCFGARIEAAFTSGAAAARAILEAS